MSGVNNIFRRNCRLNQGFILMTAGAMLRKKAFTLIELLVVMTIMIILGSMILSFVIIGQRSSAKNETLALLTKVGTAIDEFTAETGAVPLPTGSKTDPESGSWYPADNVGSWDKQQLWWRLTHEMTVDERRLLNKKGEEADVAVDRYQSKVYMDKTYDGAEGSTFEDIMSKVNSTYGIGDKYFAELYRRNEGQTNWRSGTSGHGRWNGLSGLGFYKVHYLAIKGAIARDLAVRKYLTYPCLDMQEIGSDAFLQDQTIVDSWGNPLIYVAHSIADIPAVQFGFRSPFMEPPRHGRNSLTDRNLDGTIDNKDWSVEPPEINDPVDHNGDSAVTPDDKVWKYDRNNDGAINEKDWATILWTALPGRENSFFLASAGPDGEFNTLISELENEDNVNLIEDFND